MDAGGLLQIARGIVDKVAMPLAITVGPEGEANARVVQTSKLSDDWTVRFMTDRRSRKAQEIGRTGRLTLAYQCDADNSYVALVGRARIVDDVDVKKAVEAQNFESRKHLLEYDDVMNKQREAVYSVRRRLLEGLDQREAFRRIGSTRGELRRGRLPGAGRHVEQEVQSGLRGEPRSS